MNPPGSQRALSDDLIEAAKSLKRRPEETLKLAGAIAAADRSRFDAILLCAAALRQLGRVDQAVQAEADAVASASSSSAAKDAERALRGDDLDEAQRILRERLKSYPMDIAAMRMFATAEARLGRLAEAETLLRRAVGFAPAFAAARHGLALVLDRMGRQVESLKELERLTALDADNPEYYGTKAASLNKIGREAEATAVFEESIARFPERADTWLFYGHNLRALGRQEDSVAAYRRAVELAPGQGAAWWGLANLKTFRFEDADFQRMKAALDGAATDDDRSLIHFALGKAHEDRGETEASFGNYAAANRLRREAIVYDAGQIAQHVLDSERVLTTEFFGSRADFGNRSADPIFIVGMHRSGSTLVEQILASHPLVEGTAELPDLPTVAKRAREAAAPTDSSYLPALPRLGEAEAAQLGQAYLDLTRVQRRTERPRFTDKLPSNWLHVGLIELILPNARIIDVRRHPLDCCFSNFRQHYATGVAHSYDLSELGYHYRKYVQLMAHFDAVLPGRVHRVIYEDLVARPEEEVRKLLDHLGLRFDPACLLFHENERAVRTPSSEQVRRPINTDGIGQWRPFEPWLEPLKRALGPVLELYPEAPKSRSGEAGAK